MSWTTVLPISYAPVEIRQVEWNVTRIVDNVKTIKIKVLKRYVSVGNLLLERKIY